MQRNIESTLRQIGENALKNSVVHLKVKKEIPLLSLQPQYMLSKTISSGGSGFFIDKNVIVTNCHVILGTTSVSGYLSKMENTFQVESVKAYDVENDLIVLKVTNVGTPLKLGDSNKIVNKESVCATSYAKGVPNIVQGTIDGIDRSDNRIRMKIGTAGGSSGCPIMNRKGEVVGIDASGNEKYSYAIPSNSLKSLMEETDEEMPFKVWQELPLIRALTTAEIGDDMLEDDEYKEAIVYFDTAIELKPDIAEAYKGRACARLGLSNFGRAIEDYLIYRKLNPKSIRSTGFWSYFSWKWIGIWIVVGLLFIKILRALLSDSSWCRLRGIWKSAFGKSEAKDGNHQKAKLLLQESISDFTEAISLNSDQAQIYNSRGWAKYLLGQIENKKDNVAEAKMLFHEAISDIENALQLDLKNPKYRSAYYHTRAVAKAELGEHNDAIKDLDISIKLNSENARYFFDRGLSKESLEQHKDAEIDFTKARQLKPDIEKKYKDE